MQDPAIQQVAQNTSTQQRGLEDYNPFEAENEAKPNARVGGGPVAPLPFQQQQQLPTGNMTTAGSSQMPPQLSLEEFHRRQAELDRKAAELDRREREINSAGGGAARLNNWPPLPDKCCFQPCFYHDIDQEIRIEFQKTVRNLYYVWILYAGVLFANVLGALILMIHDGEIKGFVSAVIFAFLFTPASFMCWYRPAYKAFKADSSFDFMVFFFIFFCQTVVTIIQTTLSFISAITGFGSSAGGILLGIFLLLIACGFGVCACGDVMMLSKVNVKILLFAYFDSIVMMTTLMIHSLFTKFVDHSPVEWWCSIIILVIVGVVVCHVSPFHSLSIEWTLK